MMFVTDNLGLDLVHTGLLDLQLGWRVCETSHFGVGVIDGTGVATLC